MALSYPSYLHHRGFNFITKVLRSQRCCSLGSGCIFMQLHAVFPRVFGLYWAQSMCLRSIWAESAQTQTSSVWSPSKSHPWHTSSWYLDCFWPLCSLKEDIMGQIPSFTGPQATFADQQWFISQWLELNDSTWRLLSCLYLQAALEQTVEPLNCQRKRTPLMEEEEEKRATTGAKNWAPSKKCAPESPHRPLSLRNMTEFKTFF